MECRDGDLRRQARLYLRVPEDAVIVHADTKEEEEEDEEGEEEGKVVGDPLACVSDTDKLVSDLACGAVEAAAGAAATAAVIGGVLTTERECGSDGPVTVTRHRRAPGPSVHSLQLHAQLHPRGAPDGGWSGHGPGQDHTPRGVNPPIYTLASQYPSVAEPQTHTQVNHNIHMDKLEIPSETYDAMITDTNQRHQRRCNLNVGVTADHNGNYNTGGGEVADPEPDCPALSMASQPGSPPQAGSGTITQPPPASPPGHQGAWPPPPPPPSPDIHTTPKVSVHHIQHIPQVRVELADGHGSAGDDGDDAPDPDALSHHQDDLMEGGIQPIDLKELQHRRKMRHRRKHKFVKNLLILSFSFVSLFSATNGLSLLQSSLNQRMGVFGLCANFTAVAISCLLLPTVLIQVVGCKWTIVGSMACFVLWIMANLHPTWGTLIPASVVMGTGWAPLWTAQCTYFTVTGIEYAKWVDNMPDVVIARMFGIFFMIFMTAPIWGNLLSSSILSQGPYQNRSHPLPLPGDPESIYRFCGAADCPGVTLNITNDNYRRPDSTLVYTLVGLYLGLSVVAMCLVAFFLDSLELERDGDRPKFAPADLMASLKQVANPYQVFIIPLTVYTGMEQVFMVVEYTRAYTTCALGMQKIGYVVISYAAVAAVMSLACSQLVNIIGRMPLFLMGAGAHIGCMVVFMRWTPYPDSLIMFIIMPAIWGIGDAIWQSQINAFYGVLFSDHSEAAFSNYRMWESVGFIISLSCSPFLCVYMKIYVLIGALISGLLGYFVVEGLYSKASSDLETELARKGEVVEESEKEDEAPFQGIAQLIRRKSSIYIPNSAVREAGEVMRRKSQVFLGGIENPERVIRRRLSTFVPVLEVTEDNSPASSICSTPVTTRNSLPVGTANETEVETLEIDERGNVAIRRNGTVTPPHLTGLLLQTPTDL